MPLKTIEDHPDFKPRDKHGVWIFKLKEDFVYTSKFTGHSFAGKWLRIYPDGIIQIPGGYAWDGCSFKLSILDLMVVGTPDGTINVETDKPQTYHASLVHDALYQYYRWHNIQRNEIDTLFLEMMRKRKFKLAGLYYLAVRLIGWMFTGKKHPEVKELKFEGFQIVKQETEK